jgi:hypothetical protein
MTFKKADQILEPDPRFASLVMCDERGVGAVDLGEHHRAIAAVDLANDVPPEVRAAFERARSALLYSYFDYDLLVVCEAQAFAAFEMALRQRLASNQAKQEGTLHALVERGRKHGVLPPLKAPGGSMDPFIAIVRLRNGLAHGTTDVHSPGMAMQVLELCARQIDRLFSRQPV